MLNCMSMANGTRPRVPPTSILYAFKIKLCIIMPQVAEHMSCIDISMCINMMNVCFISVSSALFHFNIQSSHSVILVVDV